MSAPWLARLVAMADREVTLADHAVLFRTCDPVRFVYVVCEGAVLLLRHQERGDSLVLHRARAGELLAEASVFAARYHCDAVAAGEALLARVAKAEVLRLQESDPAWSRAFSGHLAAEVQRGRARAQMLSHKRVGARVDAWLALHGGGLPAKGAWVELAAELAVTPEALYRELARRRG